MSERDDVARLVVLAAIGKGKGFAKAGGLAKVSPDEAREIAVAAGWPDIGAVRARWEQLRAIPSGLPNAAPAPDKSQPGPEVPDVLIGAPGPKPDARQVSTGCDIPGEEFPAVITQAQREYLGQVAPTGPIPEHLEPLADYVARIGSPLVPVISPLVSAGADEIPQISQDEFPLDPEVAAFVEDARRVLELKPLPPPTDSPAPASVKRSATRSGTLPCEVCGDGVTLAYVARTGRQRHGHHPEGS